MFEDEDAIRDAIRDWLKASKEGDSEALQALLDDDVLFVTPGQAPFGKKEFFAGEQGPPFRFESKADMLEVVVHGEWALTRMQLDLLITPARDAAPMHLVGPTMTVWRKGPKGRWMIWRDANMVAPLAS